MIPVFGLRSSDQKSSTLRPSGLLVTLVQDHKAHTDYTKNES